MQQPPLRNQIIDWLEGQAYWLQFAGNKFLEGITISPEFIDHTYNLFKEEHDLTDKSNDKQFIKFDRLAFDGKAITNTLFLKAIKEVEHVNALASGQSIAIDDQLTIVYGQNGAGKSGYIRIINKAFDSRGDKNILPNIFSTNPPGTPSCKFTFKDGNSTYDLSYPDEKTKPEFTQFSVFDSVTVQVHLAQDNKLNFTPRGFEFFETVLALTDALKSKLQAEISTKTKINDFPVFFPSENAVRTLMLNLGADSKKDEILALASIDVGDTDQITELSSQREALLVLDIPKKVQELQQLLHQLDAFITKQKQLIVSLSQDNIISYNTLITSSQQFKKLSLEDGINSLKDFNIRELGSDAWKDFIKSAQKYAEAIQLMMHSDHVYPKSHDHCLFCLQPLNERETHIIQAYWKLLKGQAESELIKVDAQILSIGEKLKQSGNNKFDETTALYIHIYQLNPSLAEKWKNIVSSSENAIQTIITLLASRSPISNTMAFEMPVSDLESIRELTQSNITALIAKDPAKEVIELDKKIQLFNDKKLLNRLHEKVFDYIADCKWVKKAQRAVTSLNTKSITIKQGELFATHITNRYTQLFSEECKKLNATINVAIQQKNVKGSTLRRLQVAGVSAHTILSEGEQRAISLADFITESLLNPLNKGIIFDDPVTSQDHIRREDIAKRLIDLSRQKQVIIFTHDVGFFVRLTTLSKESGITPTITTIRNIQGTPGIVSPDLPWVAQNTKLRIGLLKNKLIELKKTQKDSSPDDYYFEVKKWYGLLREAWERAVEERLLKGVIERFHPAIQTQKLKKITINDNLINQVEKGMTECSTWVHDMAAGLNPPPPSTDKAESDLKFFEDFANKLVEK